VNYQQKPLSDFVSFDGKKDKDLVDFAV